MDTHEQFDAAVRARGPPSPLRVAYQLTHHRADAEDVVQAALRPTLTDSTEEASTP